MNRYRPKCIEYAMTSARSKKGYDEAIRRMARGGALSETEQRALLELGKRGFAVVSDADFEKFRRYAQALHKRMAADSKASPVALAIVGAIANYAVPSPTKSGRAGRSYGESVSTSGARYSPRCGRWRFRWSSDERLESDRWRSRRRRGWNHRWSQSALLV